LTPKAGLLGQLLINRHYTHNLTTRPVVGERQPPVPYVLAAQAALGEPPEKAKTLLHDLEAKMLALGAVEQALIPSPQLLNSARSEALTARAELMQALSK